MRMMVAGVASVTSKYGFVEWLGRRGVRTALEVFRVLLARCDVEEYGDAEFRLGDICAA